MAQVALFLLSAATLAFEVNLSRIFSVSQFYHFAFMTVSLALLGFGASGTLLSLVPALGRRPRRTLVACGWGFALAAIGSYGLTLLVPFDSFRVALEPETWGILALHYVALATPFLCTGLAVGLMLDTQPGSIGKTYAANLVGSAVGCVLAVTFSRVGGAEGVVLLSAGLGVMAAAIFSLPSARLSTGRLSMHLLLPAVTGLVLLALAVQPPAALEIDLSPYKGLSYTLQLPDAQTVFQEWNGFSRVDVVAASAIRSLPGQGFACSQEPPPQRGLFVDGDNLSPVTQVEEASNLRPVTDCLLPTLAYRLRPDAEALVLHPRAGIDVWIALAEGAQTVTAVEPNPLVVRAVESQEPWTQSPYLHPRVRLFNEEGRAFLAHPGSHYDVILLSLPGTYHPITSGAYSLAEDYRYTVEGFVAGLERLEGDGLLAVTRWLQVPPSESLRAFATMVEAVERTGGDPAQSLVALRSYNQMLLLTRRGPFHPGELEEVRAFAAERAFDLVYAPGMQPEEANQHNILPSPDYYQSFTALLETEDREAWLEEYAFDVSPPTDNRPFFGHFFRWEQAGEVVAMAGHVWQPFGGAGYLVLLGLLAIGSLAAVALVLLPLAGRRGKRTETDGPATLVRLLPFGFLGLAFLLVEIPLLQRFILFLGHPSYAMATVLGALLFFSGMGSLLSDRVRLGVAMTALVGLVLVYQAGLSLFSGPLLRLPLGMRIGVVVLALAPLGMLMGIPFPNSLARLQREAPGLVAWAWGVNGALSVVSSILAALIALSWGFWVVMGLGALCYLGMWATTAWAIRSRPDWNVPPPPRP